jgi:hypothetical protein
MERFGRGRIAGAYLHRAGTLASAFALVISVRAVAALHRRNPRPPPATLDAVASLAIARAGV